MLDVPIENKNDNVLFPGSDVPWSSIAHTLDPQDKFLAPRPAPLPPTRHSNTATREISEQLASPIPPLTGLSVEPTITHGYGEYIGYELQSRCITCEQDIISKKSGTEKMFSSVESSMEAHGFPMVKSRSCPEIPSSTPGSIADLGKRISDIPLSQDYRPTTSYGRSRDVHLGMSLLQPHNGTSSSDNTNNRSSILEVDDSLHEPMRRPLTDSNQYLHEPDQSKFCFNSWPEDGQDAGRPYATAPQHPTDLFLDARFSDTSSTFSRRSQVSENSDFAVVMLDDNLSSAYYMQYDQADTPESASSFGANYQEPSTVIPQLTNLPSPCCSLTTVRPPSSPSTQFLQLERPGLLRSKFSEWSIASVDAPQSASGLALEVEDMQSPTMSAVSYSSDGIVTPRKQSDQVPGFNEQMVTSEGFIDSNDYCLTDEGFRRENSYENEYGLADMVTGLRLADKAYALRYDAWHAANADTTSAGSGAGTTAKDDFSVDYFSIRNGRHGRGEQVNA